MWGQLLIQFYAFTTKMEKAYIIHLRTLQITPVDDYFNYSKLYSFRLYKAILTVNDYYIFKLHRAMDLVIAIL